MRRKHGKRKAADTAADRLRAEILTGRAPAGSDLPAERELAERLGVSRLTLRSSLSRLEAEGLVQPVHGSGNRVLDFRRSGGVDLMAHLARLSLEGGRVPLSLLEDMLELRRVVGVEVLGLVCERASDEDLGELRAQLDVVAAAVGAPERFMDADLQFARLLVRAGRNLALELLFNTIARVIDQQPGLELAFTANAAGTVSVYRRLLALLEARDGDRARDLARRLLTRLDRATLARVEALVPRTPDDPEREGSS